MNIKACARKKFKKRPKSGVIFLALIPASHFFPASFAFKDFSSLRFPVFEKKDNSQKPARALETKKNWHKIFQENTGLNPNKKSLYQFD
jgi:hypothetical protein